MDGWKLWFALLMPLCVRGYTKETVVKTVSRQPDITPVCMSENWGMIILVKCRIHTDRHRGQECNLFYAHGKKSELECDPRFTPKSENQTVLIRLNKLTSVDSGDYTCECSYERGTHVTHLQITVEDDSAVSGTKLISPVSISLGAATTCIITAGIICGLILRRNKKIRENTGSGACELARSGIPRFLDQDDHYAKLQQPAANVYEAISSSRPNHDDVADPAHVYAVINREINGNEKDFDSVYSIYECI